MGLQPFYCMMVQQCVGGGGDVDGLQVEQMFGLTILPPKAVLGENFLVEFICVPGKDNWCQEVYVEALKEGPGAVGVEEELAEFWS